MKCDICKGKMKSTTINFDLDGEYKKVTFLNVPVYKCSECGKTIMDRLVKDNMARFVVDYPLEDVMDYRNKEGEELQQITNTLSLF